MQTATRLLPLNVVARRLRVPLKWLRSEAEAGRIPCLRADHQILTEVEAVEAALLERLRHGAASTAAGDERKGGCR